MKFALLQAFAWAAWLMLATSSFAAPFTSVTDIAAGGGGGVVAGHACVARSGAAMCWGHNDYGQLGDGTLTNSPGPIAVQGLASGVAAVAVGGSHSCALTAAGGVECWGHNYYGQLGDGTRTDRTTPVDVGGMSSGVIAISAGFLHTCVLTAAGGMSCWGINADGQLGDGTTGVYRSAPAGVTGLSSGVAAIAAGGMFTCALTSGGGVKCWGSQPGNGRFSDSSTPMDVTSLTSGVAAIEAGQHHACAVTTAGGVLCWGTNQNGQLGDGTISGIQPTPVAVSGLSSGVAAVTAGDSHTCALTMAGGVKCWGGNYRGQLGDGTDLQRSTPVDASGLASGITAVEAGPAHTCAINSSTGVVCWGENGYGELGRGASGTFQTTAAAVGLFASQTITFAQPANPDLAASPVALSATASSGLTVSFATSQPSVCTVSGSTLTLLQTGICTIIASQAGNADYFAAAAVARSVFIGNASAPNPPRLANISTRARMLSGNDDVAIAGFAVAGPASKTVVIRARGPSLAAAGVPNPLPNPRLLVARHGAAGFFASNSDWQTGPFASVIQSLGFAPADPLESAIIVTLDSGLYSAVVMGEGGGTGVAIVEVFEIDRPDSALVNIATRAPVLTGDDVMIAGFVIYGSGPQQVVVRGRGPSLAQYGIANPLANPLLQLFSGQTQIAVNDDWGMAANAAQLSASGFAPTYFPQESAILITLNPGAYTAIMSGVGNTTGVGLVEVFAVP